jgi:hypothetical protein
MPPSIIVHLSPVVGEVVEVMKSGGRSVATVALRTLHVSIPAEILDDPHLGENVLLDVDLTVKDHGPGRAVDGVGLGGT